jgi:DNA-binding NarL/FixJ family response regulator
MGKRQTVPSPKGLAVELLDDDFAVFSWDADIAPSQVVLTDAEQDVLHRLGRGASNAEIAKARKSSVNTVANQVASLLKKLGAKSRYDLVRRYARRASGT